MNTVDTKEILKKAYLRIQELEKELEERSLAYEPIAIIGGALRFSGANTPDELFEILLSGDNKVSDAPANRWTINGWKSDKQEEGKAYSFAASYLEGIELFDNQFFNIPPEECQHTDPQQRLLLETTIEALQSAGIKLSGINDTRTGVFIGSVNAGYDELISPSPTEYSPTGSIVASAAGKISYKLNLKGPALTLDTACSSSLAAIHLGCKNLQSGESDLVLAGGVNLIMTPRGHIGFSQLGAMTRDGKAKVFDKAADGFSRGEGSGIVVLKRLKDALKDNDPIIGVVRGSSMNHDGLSNGYTAPSQHSQEGVIKDALYKAGIQPGDIGYIEAHGTGTTLGDTIELQALNTVFNDNSTPVYIGSIKANLGHTEYAAGMASIFKTLKILENKKVPPQIHIKELNPHFNWTDAALKVSVDEVTDIPDLEYAGVSGFGISGTNVHLVIQRHEHNRKEQQAANNKRLILSISARTANALLDLLDKHQDAITSLSESEIADYAQANNIHRDHFEYRVLITGVNKAELLNDIIQISESIKSQGATRVPPNTTPGRTVFIFPGQGSQWFGMAATLYKEESVFRDSVHETEAAFKKYRDVPISKWIEEGSSIYLENEITIQPVLFAIQAGLAKLWMSYGIKPDAVLGMSMGEVAALYIGGAISIDEAARIICKRTELLISGVSGYEMCIAEYTKEQLQDIVEAHPGLEVSGYYTANTHLFSAPTAVMQKFMADTEAKDIFIKKAKTSVASHCSAVDNILEALKEQIVDLDGNTPSIPVFSTVYNRFLAGVDATPSYWADNLKMPILFYPSISSLEDMGYTTFVEVNAHPLTSHYFQQIFESRQFIYQPTLFRDHHCTETFFNSLNNLYQSGIVPAFEGTKVPVHPALPLYQWDKKFFPIPYANYGKQYLQQGNSDELSIMLPKWQKVSALNADVSSRPIIYYSFSDSDVLCDSTEYYYWQKDKDSLLQSFKQYPHPVIIVDTAYVDSIDNIEVILDAIKKIASSLKGDPADIVLLGKNGFPVTGKETAINPSCYAWLGLARSLQAEWENISIHWLDTDNVLRSEILLAEIQTNPAGAATIYRENNRYLLYVNQDKIEIPSTKQQVNSVFIAGGTSMMGLMIADWYAERGAKAIVLHGKRKMPAEAEWDSILEAGNDKRIITIVNSVRKLRQSAINVILLTGDLCSQDTVNEIRTKLDEEHASINDIVYVAGTSLSHYFAEATVADFIAEADTRISGWKNLVAEKGISFDRFIFMSSASGFFRSVGQSPYLFANHWIDAAASVGDTKGRKYTALLWPIWKEVGRALEEDFLPDTLLEHVSNEDIYRYFNAIIDNQHLPPVVIAAKPADNNLKTLWKDVPFLPGIGLREWINRQPAINSGLVQNGEEATNSDELHKLLQDLWKELLGKEKVYPQDHFFQAGGNSVLLIKLVNRIKSRYEGIDLKVPDLIKNLAFNAQYTFIKKQATLIRDTNSLVLEKAPFSDKYPASEEQKQIWIQCQLDEDASLYNLTGVYAYTGILNSEAFARAIVHVGIEQEIFRTRYVLEDGQVMQIVDSLPQIPIEFIDAINDDELKQLGSRIFDEESAYHFDLSEEHSFRIKVVKGKDNNGLLILNLHHIASDGWALGYYTSRLADVYKAYCKEVEPEHFQTEFSYKDYSVYQQQYLQSTNAQNDAAFWKEHLSSGPASIYIKEDSQRPSVFAFRGKKIKLCFTAEESENIRTYIARSGISLYSFLQTALSVYLSLRSGETEIVTGTPMSSRIDERFEQVVGNFVNLTPIHVSVDNKRSFLDIAKDVQHIIGDVLIRQLYPFNRIIQDMNIKRDPSRHPVFDILFVLQNHTEADLQLDGLKIKRDIIDPEHSKLDLFIETRDANGLIEFNFEYNDHLFNDETIAEIWKGLSGLINTVAGRNDGHLKELHDVSGNNIEKEALAVNALTDILKQFENNPQGIAIKDGLNNISYDHLDSITNEIAGYLSAIRQQINPASFYPVGVACGRSASQVISMIAAWKAGMVYMPVNLSQTAPHIKRQLNSSKAEILICSKTDWNSFSKDLDTYPNLRFAICFLSPFHWEIFSIINGSTEKIKLIPDHQSHVYPGGGDAAYIVFTSGSTGVPKAIVGRHDSLAHFIAWQSQEFGIEQDVNTAWLIQPTFDASFRDVLLPLYNGGTVNIPEQEVLELIPALVQWMNDKKINAIHTVPSLFRVLMDEIEAGYKGIALYPDLKYVFLSGEALYKNDIERWQGKFGTRIQLVNFYGSSETTLIRTFYRIPLFSTIDENSVPVGMPLADTSIVVLAKDGICQINEPGTVYVQTHYPTLGYLQPDGTTSNVLAYNATLGQEAYNSGDIGKINSNGDLVIIGRNDDQVKVHGIRVHTSVIEAAIANIKGIKQAAVVYDDQSAVLKAFYSSETNIDISELRKHLSEELIPQQIPDIWTQLDFLPLTPHGKVDRPALKNLDTQTIINKPTQELKTETEHELARLWTNVLKLEDIGRDSNFFEAGGNSLNGLILLSRVHKELKRKVTLRALFANPVLADMAAVIEKLPQDGLDAIPKIEVADWYPVSQAQRRMWILHNMEEHSITYNIKRAYEINGHVDGEMLQQAFEDVISRQDSLRTNFRILDGVPVQFIRPLADALFTMEQVDLSAIENAETVVRELANKEVHYHFDLEHESLLRASLVKLSGDRHVLLISLHHIISDGWSMELLMKELFTRYNNFSSGIELSQTPLAIQYKDYAAWQDKKIDENTYIKERSYWLNELSGDIPILEIPYDGIRSKIKSYQGEPLYFRLNEKTKMRIAEICRAHDVSLFMFLLSTVKVLLHKYTGQRDLIIGSPVAGRNHPDLSTVIGFFVNMLALRSNISPDMSFGDYLDTIRKKTLDGFEHQNYPFDKLVEELPLQRDTSRSPLFDITVQVLNVEFWENQDIASHLHIKPFIADWERSQFDLSFFFKEEKNGIFALIEFNNTIYSPKRIQRLISHFTTLLENILDAPETTINQLQYIPKYEQQQLIYQFNDNRKFEHYESSVVSRVINNTSNDIAVNGLKNDLRYDELSGNSKRIASFLLEKAQHKKSVAVLTDEKIYLVQAMTGIMRSGNVYMPLDPQHPSERLKYMLQNAKTEVIITTRNFLPLADKLLWECDFLQGYICIDSGDIHTWIPGNAELMRQDLWNYVGKQAQNDIEAGGWTSSYTGAPFTEQEMEEYAQNAYEKLQPFLTADTRVLEIGCSSGLTLFKVAPNVKSYVGLDLSEEILTRTRAHIKDAGLNNVSLYTLFADEVEQLSENGFDLVIINSVIQSFGSYNYFRKVLEQVLTKVNNKAILFLGDVQDMELKDDLITSLLDFSQANQGMGYRTKITWDDELFFHKDFLRDIALEYPSLSNFSFSNKSGTIKNELTLFRYDAIISIDKANTQPLAKRHKWQASVADLFGADFNEVIVDISASDPAYVIFTSGTSGMPKGVLINHGALLNQVKSIAGSFNNSISPADRILMVCRSTFDVSLLELFTALYHGGTLVELNTTTPLGSEYLVSMLDDKKITWAYLPPALLSGIVEEIEHKQLSINLNKLLVGVEPIPAEVLTRFANVVSDIQIVNGYGPTEATIVTTTYSFNKEDDYATVPIGRPLPGYKVYIIDEAGEPTGIGIPGEIVIAGEGLADEYINNKSLTTEKFKPLSNIEPRAYYTGDIGLWDANGNVNFIGRKDTQVKFNGYRIELSEIESQLSGYPGVNKAVVLLIKLDDDLKQLVAFVQSKHQVEELELKQYVASRLPEFMLPQRIIILNEFPLTSHGKLNLTALSEMVMDAGASETEIVDPSNRIEEQILELYKNLLKQQGIGITHNFFDLGGHSLVATRLVTKAAKEYNLAIPLVNVFIYPTVRELSTSITGTEINTTIPQVKVQADNLYPLSYAQQRLWIIDHLNPDDDAVRAAYNMVGLFKVMGSIDIDELTRAIQLVIDNHESLRTNFVEKDGKAYQLIHDHVTFSAELYNMPNCVDADVWIEEATERIASKALSLEKDRLIRCCYFKCETASYIVFVMHHIISDGWSMHIFSKELQKAIQYLRDKTTPLQRPSIQYKDYAAWNTEQVGHMEDARNYWHQILSEEQSPTCIPCDYERPGWRTFNGDTMLNSFSQEASKTIHEYCNRNQLTLYSFLVSVLQVLIHRYTGLHNITIGSPVSGRTHAQLDDQIGFYLNNIVLRSHIDGATAFDQFASDTHAQILKALEYQDYPFDKLVDEMLKERDTAHSPFFDIYLALQNNESPYIDFNGYSFETIPISRRTSRYDLNFMFAENDGLHLQLQYNTDLYRTETAEALSRHFINLVNSIVSNLAATISELKFLDNDETKQLLSLPKAVPVYNPAELSFETPEVVNKTIIYHFAEQVKRNAKRVAVTDGDISLSYAELDIASDNIAASLISNGIKPGDIVALCIGRNLQRIIGILGVLKSGAAYLPMDPSLPAARMQLLTGNAESHAILTDVTADNFESWFNGKIVSSSIDKTEQNFNAPDITGDHSAYVLYTSGTTGEPKGVVVTHANVVSLMKETNLYDFNEKDVWTLFHQYNFDFSVWEMFGALLFGGKAIVVSDELSKDLNAFSELIVREKVTVLNQTPPVFYLVSELLLANSHLPALRYVIFGGDALQPSLLLPFADKFPDVKLVNMYGITETTVHVTLKLLNREDMLLNHSNIGKPIPTLGIYILDEYLQLMPEGMPGQLAISGKGLSKGYIKDADLTVSKFVNHPVINDRVYLSGDLARLLPGGDIEYLGRIDQQLKIRGHRIEPGEVSFALQQLSYIDKAEILKAGEADSASLLAFVQPGKDWRENEERLSSIATSANAAFTYLENGIPFFHKNESETKFMYREIVEEDGYMLQKIELSDRPVIIDAGANIGMFSVMASAIWPKASIYAFEPMPEIYACLAANAALHTQGRVKAFNEGLSDQKETTELHYYALNTVMSGGGSQDSELLTGYIRQQYEQQEMYSDDTIASVVEEALASIPVSCKMRSLSDVIDEERIEHIDLIKIDVEEWEQKLINGIRDEHWKMIDNLIAEVHDINGRVDALGKFLVAKGFNIEVQQTSMLKGVPLVNLKASRAKINGVMPESGRMYRSFTAQHPQWLTAKQLTQQARKEVSATLPYYMVPDAMFIVDEFPLTVNGKLDRKRLFALADDNNAIETDIVLSERGHRLLRIISEVLQKEINPAQNFFEVGGHSLNATQVVNRVKAGIGIDLKVRDIFEHPLFKDLATYIDNIGADKLPPITQVVYQPHYPLSDAQQRIITTTIIEGQGSSAYNMTGGMLVTGVINIPVLKHSLQLLAKRHEILRTRFAEIGGEYVQILEDSVEVEIAETKIAKLDEQTCRKLILQAAGDPFDLSKLPLFTCLLYHQQEDHSLLVLSMHHIISDGWSLGVMNRDLTAIYNAAINNKEPELPELQFQYKDYSAWLEKLNQSAWASKEAAFWENELSGHQMLELPYDFNKGLQQTYKGAGLSHDIDEWNSISGKLQSAGRSVYSFLLAAMNLVFYKITGQADITLGTPVAGRPSLELEQQLGFYVNTLPVRLVLDNCHTFGDVLDKAYSKCIEIFDHQLYPFNKIVQHTIDVRSMEQSPLFNVLFVLQNNEQPQQELQGVKMTKVDVDYESSLFDMSFIFSERNGVLRLTLQYNSSLFTKDTAEALTTMLCTAIEKAGKGFDLSIEELEF